MLCYLPHKKKQTAPESLRSGLNLFYFQSESQVLLYHLQTELKLTLLLLHNGIQK